MRPALSISLRGVDTPSRFVVVRLTDEELATLDNLAAGKRMSRPELACQAISAQIAV